jgi:hypothetical protein
MIKDILEKQKLEFICGENVVIGRCIKMGSSTLDSIQDKHKSIKNKKLKALNDKTHNIILIRDIDLKWKSGVIQDLLYNEFNLPQDLLRLLENGYWLNTGFKESLKSDNNIRVKNTKRFTELMIALHDLQGTSNLNWMFQDHAKFYCWNNGMTGQGELNLLSLYPYMDIENYYFMELSDLSSPKFKKWITKKDTFWEGCDFTRKNKTSDNAKLQLEIFWEEYNDGQNPLTDSTFLREYNLVSPFSNIIGGYKYNNIIHDVYQMNCNAIEYIRNSHPRYLKF